MAINYGNYAQLYGQGVDISPVQEAIQRFQEASKEKMAGDVQMIVNDTWTNAMKPFESALSGDINTLDTLNLQNENAGKAFSQFQIDLRRKGDKYYREATRLGLLNPVTFKQEYERMFKSYVPKIENRLMTHMKMNNLSDKEMEEFINKSGLNSYLLQYGDDASPLKKLAQPERTWGQWYRQKGGAEGLAKTAALLGLGTGAGIYGAKKLYDIGTQSSFNPFKTKDLPLSDKQSKSLDKILKEDPLSKKAGKAFDKKSERLLNQANEKYNKAEAEYKKNYKGKSKNPRFKTTKEGKELSKNITNAQRKIGTGKEQGIKSVRSMADRVIKKHGKSKALRLIAKKVGPKAALSIFAKLGLGMIPAGFTQAVSAGLLAADIKMIYDVLTELAE